MKKLLVALIIFLVYGIVSYNLPYDKDKAVEHIESNALSRSHNCCAWFVMRAMQSGGCPIGILPAWGYRYVLFMYGFKEVPKSNHVRQKGDIVVFPHIKGHIFGHIAMWTSKQWMSDFKQKGLIVAKGYEKSDYRYYRHN